MAESPNVQTHFRELQLAVIEIDFAEVVREEIIRQLDVRLEEVVEFEEEESELA